MTFILGPKSRASLAEVHPKLVRVVERAILISAQDFIVLEGIRTLARQRSYVRKGTSRTMNSKHLRQPDGFAHAVDVVGLDNGKPDWEWPGCYNVAVAMGKAAAELRTELIWGGAWDRQMSQLEHTPAGLERACREYSFRRFDAKRAVFLDGPHFELVL